MKPKITIKEFKYILDINKYLIEYEDNFIITREVHFRDNQNKFSIAYNFADALEDGILEWGETITYKYRIFK